MEICGARLELDCPRTSELRLKANETISIRQDVRRGALLKCGLFDRDRRLGNLRFAVWDIRCVRIPIRNADLAAAALQPNARYREFELRLDPTRQMVIHVIPFEFFDEAGKKIVELRSARFGERVCGRSCRRYGPSRSTCPHE